MRTPRAMPPKAARRKGLVGRVEAKLQAVEGRGRGVEVVVMVVVVVVGEEDHRPMDTLKGVDSLRHRLRGADLSNNLSIGRDHVEFRISL